MPRSPLSLSLCAQPNYMSAQLPRDASSTLYVEGLPSDATEREVAHIFRRFEGHVPSSPLHPMPTVPPAA